MLSRSRHKTRKNGRSLSSISTWRYISFMSHANATVFRRKRSSASKSSRCNFGFGSIMSFNETPSVFAEPSNTIRTFVVDFSILITGKCGKCHISGGIASSFSTFRKYPFSTYDSIVFWYYLHTAISFFNFFSVLASRFSACSLLFGSVGRFSFHGVAIL